MKKILRIFLTGCIISFLGSLPLGTMNLAAIHITIRDGAANALVYSMGSLMAELIYIRLVLMAMSWVSRQYRLFRLLEWITIIIIFILSVSSFIAAGKTVQTMSFTSHIPHPFIWGFVISIVNPLHIPFWLGWSTVLVNKKILDPSATNYRSYMTGISVGTLGGFAVFIAGAGYFSKQLMAAQQTVNFIIGALLLLTAIVQAYRIMMKPQGPAYRQS